MFRNVIFAASITMATPAFAGWESLVDGPNVFGATEVTVVAELTGGSGFFLIKCDSDGEFDVGWAYETSDEVANLNVNFILMNDSGGRANLEARLFNWNDKLAFFGISDNEEAREALEIISGAQSKIEFGISAPEVNAKLSARASARNSTSSISVVKEHCTAFSE